MKTNRMTIKIIDNFLSENNYHKIKELLMGNSFEWRYVNSVLGNLKKHPIMCSENDNYQFVHSFYDNYRQKSNFYDSIFPFFEMDKLNPKSIIKVKANLTTRTVRPIIHGFHVDLQFSCKTAIYYVNSNDGFTMFLTGEKVESVGNRMVIFDSNIYHSGSTCSDQKTRVVINFNYF